MNLAVDAEQGPRRLRDLSRRARAILLALVLGGAALRVAYQWNRPFTGDEIGTLLFLKKDYALLFTQFRSWLTMNFYLAGLKALAALCGNSPWTLVAPSLLAGVAVIPVVTAITLRLSSVRHALLAAALTAYNPFLVHYSAQIRSYMLLTCFALLAALSLLDWLREPGWAHGWRVALYGAAGFLIHPNGIYQVGALALLCCLWRRLDRPVNWTGTRARELVTLAAPALLLHGLVLLAYRPLLADMAVFRKDWSYTPPTSVLYLPQMFADYFAGGYSSLVTLILILAGLWWAARTRPALLSLSVLVSAPLVFVALMGVSHFPWAYSRFLLPILPLAIILIAFPLFHSQSRVLTLALIATPFVAWAPGLARLFAENRDYPWTAVAEHLVQEVSASERLIAVDYMSQHQLSAQDKSYEAQFVDAAALVKLSRRRNQEPFERLLVLCDEPHLVTTAESRSLGRVQLVTYRGEPRAMLDQLIADLTATAGGRIESSLSSHYKLLYDILDALKRDDEAQDVLVRMLNCTSLLHRERLRPIQQR
ncbi:MAG: hypothetical protein EXS08_12945 [Planctomycetes bacterium]|nr:hypothetical protein [Planctomycetota bacterium]